MKLTEKQISALDKTVHDYLNQKGSFRDIVETVESFDSWVSVDERMPEDLTICLGYSEEYEYSTLVKYEIERLGFLTQMDAGWDQSEFGDSISHWQPLHEPPK